MVDVDDESTLTRRLDRYFSNITTECRYELLSKLFEISKARKVELSTPASADLPHVTIELQGDYSTRCAPRTTANKIARSLQTEMTNIESAEIPFASRAILNGDTR